MLYSVKFSFMNVVLTLKKMEPPSGSFSKKNTILKKGVHFFQKGKTFLKMVIFLKKGTLFVKKKGIFFQKEYTCTLFTKNNLNWFVLNPLEFATFSHDQLNCRGEYRKGWKGLLYALNEFKSCRAHKRNKKDTGSYALLKPLWMLLWDIIS